MYRTLFLLVLIFLFLTSSIYATDPRPVPPPAPVLSLVDPNKQGYDIPEGIERQHVCTLNAVEVLLRKYRPSFPDTPEHQMALLAIDEVLHYSNPEARESKAVKSFLKCRLRFAIEEMRHTKVTSGAVIWKLYDHAFVVRTASVTFAFDLTRGYAPDADFDGLSAEIIDQCDVLFISHEHGDHYDPWVVQRFREQGKPVYMPGSLERDGVTKHRISLSGGRELNMVVFPGYQKDLINDVRLVITSESLSFVHTGDLFKGSNTPADMFKWIDSIRDTYSVDVLLVNVWVTTLPRVVRGLGPNLVMTGHENEMGHTVQDRKPYHMSYDRLRGVAVPGIVAAWGESYYYSAPSAK